MREKERSRQRVIVHPASQVVPNLLERFCKYERVFQWNAGKLDNDGNESMETVTGKDGTVYV